MTAQDTFDTLKYRVEVDVSGTKRYRNSMGELHREGGPAVIYSDDTRVWYIDGKLHRTDGPAVEWANGNKVWHVNGKLHRADGPAVEYANGSKSWYVDGIELTENEFNELVKK